MEIKDILLYESGNGGDFNLKNNDIDVVVGLANMVFLCLFGGNIEENTTNETKLQSKRTDYWANELLDLNYNSNFEKR